MIELQTIWILPDNRNRNFSLLHTSPHAPVHAHRHTRLICEFDSKTPIS